jgi:hypothetical protein
MGLVQGQSVIAEVMVQVLRPWVKMGVGGQW